MHKHSSIRSPLSNDFFANTPYPPNGDFFMTTLSLNITLFLQIHFYNHSLTHLPLGPHCFPIRAQSSRHLYVFICILEPDTLEPDTH
ncbi:hypothetical protein AR158_c732R [Paramecium bursaria Chlorella virus AR158]|uniref:hypothetical protein n=1 Tax=Paramecium bursaria Chlorella virus AR158 TaxID=380598 RepID=UPI00015AA894|nr:hypothetical protein AR158_c732R [Paramecium bursaria Chlorella virus AR158]ABU44277.1 hypothetical protein AR158_c732R [Paramecium bursaria Chlorella virus AR158]